MTTHQHRLGVLLLQLGTPDSTTVPDVRRYLRSFLSDPRVLDMPAPARSVLLNAVILPFRPRRSSEAYEKIWTEDGSPLIVHTKALANRVGVLLGHGYRVAYGMRYGQPSIEQAIAELTEAGCDGLVVLPLFPQYASATGGSALERTLSVVGEQRNVPSIRTISAFYDDPGFLRALAGVARPLLGDFAPDHVLFSYHGLPEKQVKKGDASRSWCLASSGCCDQITDTNHYCYRAQCYATTRGLVAELGCEEGSFTTTFQSRLAGQKWIEPYTDEQLPLLFASGVRRLGVLTPSFTADCLETLEEVGIRCRARWRDLGGDDFLLVPCLNADDSWARAVVDLITKVH